MGLTRAAHQPYCIHRSFKITRSTLRVPSNCRTLWFWGRRNRGWFGIDEETEERLRRHQALMMHRYTKTLRRRSLWDRENSPSYPAWRLRGKHLEREMSSTKPRAAKVEDPKPSEPAYRRNWHEYHNDFESFKKAVDRAIERDPHGTLFGRRLDSHRTLNNSSWTSWSWIFSPKPVKQESDEQGRESPMAKRTDPEAVKNEIVTDKTVPDTTTHYDSNLYTSGVSHINTSSRTTTSLGSSSSVTHVEGSAGETEFVYDPISGRKVPRPQKSHNAVTKVSPVANAVSTVTPVADKVAKIDIPRSQAVVNHGAAKPRKGIFETMFGEHNAVDIPVKNYKAPKVYGYTGEAQKKAAAGDKNQQKRAQSSRKHEYDQLRLRTIGNNIDATNFNCEPWNNTDAALFSKDNAGADNKESVKSDDALFSGTAYAHRAEELTGRSDWLQKEGFRARQGMTISTLREPLAKAVSSPKHTQQIEPALDRLKDKPEAIAQEESGPKLESSVDRAVKSVASRTHDVNSRQSSVQRMYEQERKEDIDLLRASDVRAAAKAARLTKQELEDKKRSDRNRLEKDFAARQDEVRISKPTASRISLESSDKQKVQQHVEQYPNGIVARTLRDLGIQTATPASQTSQETTTQATTKHTFSQPTIKPGVARNLTIEKHTMDFEPKVADISDNAKQVRQTAKALEQELTKLRGTQAVAGSRELESINTDGHYTAPFVLLVYNKEIRDVRVMQLNNLIGQTTGNNKNAMAAISSLHNPNAFVKHFADLDRSGYELTSGNSDMLVFQKRTLQETSPLRNEKSNSTSALRRDIANAEIAAQPEAHTPKVATSTMNDIHARTTTSGTTAATAQHSVHSSTSDDRCDEPPKVARSSFSRVSRQEEVFSGQRRLPPHITGLPDPEHFQKQTPIVETELTAEQKHQESSEPSPGILSRIRSTFRKVVLTTLALGVGAYGIGAISEALNGKAQIAGSGIGGPMKKLVLEDKSKRGDRQRAGIFSTESSR